MAHYTEYHKLLHMCAPPFRGGDPANFACDATSGIIEANLVFDKFLYGNDFVNSYCIMYQSSHTHAMIPMACLDKLLYCYNLTPFYILR